MNFSMELPVNTGIKFEAALNRADANVVLVREAGVPFQPELGNASGIDPFAECPTKTAELSAKAQLLLEAVTARSFFMMPNVKVRGAALLRRPA